MKKQRFPTHAPGLPSAPRWLTFYIPLLAYPILAASAFIHQPFYHFWQRKEGAIEYVAVILLLYGIIHGIIVLARYRDRLPTKWLTPWFAIATLGMFVLMGEEISWGQHLGLWTSEQIPEALLALNDQNESNFHNISNIFDQGPTNLVVIGTFVAFVLLPFYQRYKRETMTIDNPGYWFWPTRVGLIAAIGVLLIPFPNRIYEWITGEDSSILRHSEFHEFYIELLMTIYMVDLYHRVKAAPIIRKPQ